MATGATLAEACRRPFDIMGLTMMKVKTLLAGLLCCGSLHAATYNYSGPNYPAADIASYGSPAYTTSMHLSGSITTTIPLASNLPLTDIGPDGTNLVQSWDFTDGLYEYTPATSAIAAFSPDRASPFYVATDAAGNIISFAFEFTSPGPPNTVGQLLHAIVLVKDASGNLAGAVAQTPCTSVASSENDICTGNDSSTFSSEVIAPGGSFQPATSAPVNTSGVAAPAYSWLGLAVLAMLILSATCRSRSFS